MGSWLSRQRHQTVNLAVSDLRGCKSLTAHKFPRCPPFADVAQLVEHVIGNDEVRGSIPRVGSLLNNSPVGEKVLWPKRKNRF